MTIAIHVAFSLVLVLAAFTIAVHLLHGVEPKRPDPPAPNPPAPRDYSEERPTVAKSDLEQSLTVLKRQGVLSPQQLEQIRKDETESRRAMAELQKKLLL